MINSLHFNFDFYDLPVVNRRIESASAFDRLWQVKSVDYDVHMALVWSLMDLRGHVEVLGALEAVLLAVVHHGVEHHAVRLHVVGMMAEGVELTGDQRDSVGRCAERYGHAFVVKLL